MLTFSTPLYPLSRVSLSMEMCAMNFERALNTKSLDKSFVYKGVPESPLTISITESRWLISLRVNCPSPTPINFNWHSAAHLPDEIHVQLSVASVSRSNEHRASIDSSKCNYFNRPSNKPLNFQRTFFFSLFIILSPGKNMNESAFFPFLPNQCFFFQSFFHLFANHIYSTQAIAIFDGLFAWHFCHS